MPSPLSPDVSGMTAAARDIRGHADDLRRHRAALSARCSAVPWHSPAAIRFQRRAADTLARMDACVHALDRSAAALDRHAHAVHDRIAELAAIPATIGHAGAGLLTGIGSGLNRAVHRVARP